MNKAVILMGSKKDVDYCREIGAKLDEFEIETEMHIASAHKTPKKVLDIIKKYEQEDCIFITVAGRSNALSGFVDANSSHPVIASPVYSSKFSGADIFSTLRMPTGVSPMTVLGAENAAVGAAKILSVKNVDLRGKIIEYHKKLTEKIENDNKEL